MKQLIKSILKKTPGIKRYIAEHDAMRGELTILHQRLADLSEQENQMSSSAIQQLRFAPPGHFYSPLPSIEELKQNEQKIFGRITDEVLGINLNQDEQIKLLQCFKDYYDEIPFQAHKVDKLRYYFENPAYSYSDAIFLYFMIRHLKPKRIIEIGSGFSSCVTLDTNELFFNNSIDITFIEPYPELLLSLISEEDKQRIKIIPDKLQDVNLKLFASLEENDILFIDSTHVSKINSDVNTYLFEIFPRLSPGVYIHIHDMFFPFEYPREWFFEGRAWNEIYALRSFLLYNDVFKIVLMNTFMEQFYADFFNRYMPLCMKDTGGSIWLRKDS